MFNWLKTPKWEDLIADALYRKAKEFQGNFEPTEGIAYRWVYDQAIMQFNDITDTVRDLDNKADSMIKYLAPSSGLLGAAIIYFSSQAGFSSVLISAGIGILLIIGAMALSAWALMPHQQAMMPSIEDALMTADYNADEEKAFADFATGIELTVAIKHIVSQFKSERIKWSYKLFALALIWLFGVTPLVHLIIT